MPHYTLYGAPISYFTGKVRAYLDWKGLDYQEVLSTADVYRDVILPKVGFPVIPVVVTDTGEALQDSTDIIETLEHRHGGMTITPTGGTQRLAAALLELYGDEWLVIPAMHYRWHHNRDWGLRAFGEVNAPHASAQEQLLIGTRRAGPFAQAASLLGASTPQMQAAIERSYEGLVAELDRHFSTLPYVLGTRPSVADFGLYGPLYAHQYRDPASGALMRQLAPQLVKWVQRLETQTQKLSGEFLGNDEVPLTLEPVFRRQMREQMPVLAEAVIHLRHWQGEHPGERIPRSIGMQRFVVDGTEAERIIRPYSLWMLQRAHDVYVSLGDNERVRADAWLDSVGGECFRTLQNLPRLVRSGLSVAPAP